MSLPDALRADTSASPALAAAPLSWRDRFLGWRDALYAHPVFQKWAAELPIFRTITRIRSRAVFDLVSGFVYSQTLSACFELGLFKILADGPQDLATLARRTGMPADGLERLLKAAMSLDLLQGRSRGRFGLGKLAGPLVHDTALAHMVAHHRHFYADLANPLAVLRKQAGDTALAKFWSYAEAARPQDIDAGNAAEYSGIMAETIPPLAADVLDHYDLGRHRRLMDVGGGEGVFLAAAAQRHSSLEVQLFDLPPVVARAAKRFETLGLASRATMVGGNFHDDPLPKGADVISLVRVLLDHSDAKARMILRRVREALPPGGVLLVAEPVGGRPHTAPLADAYFGFYLWAMGSGRARSEAEHREMLAEAGFSSVRRVPTRTPFWTDLLVATVEG